MSKRPQLSSKINVGRQQATPPRAPKLPEVDREQVMSVVQQALDSGMDPNLIIRVGELAAAVIRDPKTAWPAYKQFMIENQLETEESLGAKPPLAELTMYAVMGEAVRSMQSGTDMPTAEPEVMEPVEPVAPTGLPQ